MAVLEALNLRDLLRMPDDDPSRQRRTLRSVLKINGDRSHGRSLVDVLNAGDSSNDHRLGWRCFVQCLGFLRASAISCRIPTGRAVTDGVEPTALPGTPPQEETVRRTSVSLATALAAEREISDMGPPVSDGQDYQRAQDVGSPIRVTLMALLEASDGDAMIGPASTVAAAMLKEWVASGGENSAGGGDEEVGSVGHACCVCMVRQKGAAFIPCGHTFCRDCSRELWVSRGSCPRCNVFILEILDIF